MIHKVTMIVDGESIAEQTVETENFVNYDLTIDFAMESITHEIGLMLHRRSKPEPFSIHVEPIDTNHDGSEE